MTLRVRSWFRDDGSWTSPDGRPRELLVLLVGLPVFAWFAFRDTGVPHPGESWPVVFVGICSGFCYAVYYASDSST